MGAPRLSREAVAAILDDFRSDVAIAEIARRHGLSERHVYVLAKDHGLRRRVPPPTVQYQGIAVTPAEMKVLTLVKGIAARGEALPTNDEIGRAVDYLGSSVGHALRGLVLKGLIRMEGQQPGPRRLTIVATGEATSGDGVVAAIPAGVSAGRGDTVTGRPCTYCGARPDACACGRTAW